MGSDNTQYTRMLFQGPMMTFDLAEITMKMCACVASLGTFKRVVDIHEMPNMFMCLPSLLLALFAVQKFTRLKEEPGTLGMITGALVGVLTGFLSGIDKVVQPDVPDAFHDFQPKSPVVYNLEILHIPVVLGCVMYSFCLVFERLPAGNRLKWAGMVGLCGAVLVMMFRMMVMETSHYLTNSGNQVVFFCVLALSFFLLGLIPVATQGQTAWVLCVVCWMNQLIWQSSFFDNLQWNWAENQFPIPGFLTGIIILFFGDVLISLRTPATLAMYNYKIKNNSAWKEPLEPMLNAFLWHAITFIVQKMSLYIIQQKNKAGPHIPPYTLETTITCVLSFAFLFVVSNSLRATPVMRAIIVILALVYYVFQGLASLGLPNGLFVDVILGQMIVYSIQIHHLEQIQKK